MSDPITITQSNDQPANWAPHALDAWRQLKAERDARVEAERDRDAHREMVSVLLEMVGTLERERDTARRANRAMREARQSAKVAA